MPDMRAALLALTPMVSDEWPTTGEWLNRDDVLRVLADHPETDDGAPAPGGSLPAPEATPTAAPSSLAGQRERIADVLVVHQPEYVDPEVGHLCGCDDRGELPCMPTVFQVSKHQADAVLATLVDLGSEETRRKVERTLEAHLPDGTYVSGCNQARLDPVTRRACGYDGSDIGAHLARAVVAALTSGEQP